LGDDSQVSGASLPKFESPSGISELQCFCDLASRKSVTIGMMALAFSIGETWLVFGRTANLDSERGRRSP
jgi:hypothetical protein